MQTLTYHSPSITPVHVQVISVHLRGYLYIVYMYAHKREVLHVRVARASRALSEGFARE